MATFETKEIPFTYNENGSTQDITIISVFDTELKKTFIYQKRSSILPGLPSPGRTLLGTISAPNNNIIPYQNSDGSFNASNGLRNQLSTNTSLKQNVSGSVRNAAKEYLNPGGAFDPNSITEQQVDSLLGTNVAAVVAQPSTSQPPPTGPSPGNPSLPSPTPTTTDLDSISIPTDPGSLDPKKYQGSGGGGLRYPEKISPDEDYVKFEVYEYKPKTLTGVLNSPVGDVLGGLLGECILPIQSQISDSNTVGWGDGRVNAIELEAFKLAKTGINQGLQNMASEAGKALEQVIGNQTYGNAFKVYAASQAAQVNDLFTRATGGILNPNLELLFQGPELRTFNFNFQLSPRSEPEAKQVRQIIKFFKRSMSVNRSDTDIFLKSPHVFKIVYYKSGGIHKSLNRFKTCALRSFNVDYTPLGTYMTFDDAAGTMVSYGLSMQFQEIDPIFNDDYDKVADDEIGF